jgi:hypothetical protein
MVLNQQERKNQTRDYESFTQGPPRNETDSKADDTADHTENQGRTRAQPNTTAPTSHSLSTEPHDQRFACTGARDPERERVRGEGDAKGTEFLRRKCPRG